jgi:hypothetical protein
MSKAAQGFLLRRTFTYAADGNPRRTKLIGKRAIFGWKLYAIRSISLNFSSSRFFETGTDVFSS